MIAIREQLPLLRVGREEVVHYEESWVHDIITDAAQRAGCEDSWFAEDIAKGVVTYLKERFKSSSIGIDELFEKIGRTLCAVGFKHVAGNLRPSAPPARLSLDRLAQDAGHSYELGFFALLNDRIETFRQLGTRRLHCSELTQAVERLCQAKRWNGKCDQLRDEILDYVARELSRDRDSSETVSLMIT